MNGKRDEKCSNFFRLYYTAGGKRANTNTHTHWAWYSEWKRKLVMTTSVFTFIECGLRWSDRSHARMRCAYTLHGWMECTFVLDDSIGQWDGVAWFSDTGYILIGMCLCVSHMKCVNGMSKRAHESTSSNACGRTSVRRIIATSNIVYTSMRQSMLFAHCTHSFGIKFHKLGLSNL